MPSAGAGGSGGGIGGWLSSLFGGGGGGSVSAAWLAGLLLACAWLWRQRHTPRNLRP